MNERDEAAIKSAVQRMDGETLRELVKEAIAEKLDEYVRLFGWWSLRTLALAVVSAVGLAIIYFKAHG